MRDRDEYGHQIKMPAATMDIKVTIRHAEETRCTYVADAATGRQIPYDGIELSSEPENGRMYVWLRCPVQSIELEKTETHVLYHEWDSHALDFFGYENTS